MRLGLTGIGSGGGIFKEPSPPDHWGFSCETSLRILWENVIEERKKNVKDEPGRDNHTSLCTSLSILFV